MIRVLALVAILAVGNLANAATVAFTSSAGFNAIVGADVLGINGRSFAAIIETTGAATSLGSHISFVPGGLNTSFTLGAGTVATGGATSSFTGIAAAGGVLNFSNINVSLPNNFTQANWNAAVATTPLAGGAASWVVGTTVYVASVEAVPEPSSAIALGGLLCGVIGLSRRRRA